MLTKELLKLTPKERDVIFLWRILSRPKILTAEEINAQCGYHSLTFIRKTIKKYNHNCRIKLEIYKFNKDIEDAITSFFCKD